MWQYVNKDRKMKAKDLVSGPPSILLFGAAGTGKTALAAQSLNAYMMDFDNGMRTALTLKDKFTDLRQNIEFDLFVDSDPYKPTAMLNAKAKLMQIHSAIGKKTWPYQALIIDSLTGLCRAAQLQVMSGSGNSMGTPQIQHFGMIVNEVESVLTILRSLGVMVIVTAHEMLVETDNSVLIRIMSATRPHGMNKIPWLFDEVLHTVVRPKGADKIDYIVSGRPSMSLSTRTRSGINSDIVINDIGLAGLLEKMNFVQKAGV